MNSVTHIFPLSSESWAAYEPTSFFPEAAYMAKGRWRKGTVPMSEEREKQGRWEGLAFQVFGYID